MLLTLTGLAHQSCILFSASAGDVFPLVNKAINVSETKQENGEGFQWWFVFPWAWKHCKETVLDR